MKPPTDDEVYVSPARFVFLAFPAVQRAVDVALDRPGEPAVLVDTDARTITITTRAAIVGDIRSAGMDVPAAGGCLLAVKDSEGFAGVARVNALPLVAGGDA